LLHFYKNTELALNLIKYENSVAHMLAYLHG